MPDVDVLNRAWERERKARKQAEALLEEKTRELFRMNSELRETLIALGQQSKRTEAILENAAEGIVTYDATGAIESANPAFCRILGVTSADLIGRSIYLFFPSEVTEGTKIDFVYKRSDGTSAPLDLTVSKTPIGDHLLCTAIIRDITARRELERQLSHAQKMESVGQLAAGIAHEINTPMQYLGDNLRFLDESFRSLFELVGAFQELHHTLTVPIGSGGNCDTIVDRIEETETRIDVEFLIAEIPLALQQSLEGAERVCKIVRAMREFSHPGVKEKTQVDIHRIIESTITVSRHEWKTIAEMTTDFDPQLKTVRCLAGEFNQAILNLVVNAAHAIQSKPDRNGLGRITISTRLDGDIAEVRVADTGTGIPQAIQERIFDPFFTTKPVGVGTGQGLAIAYSAIVEKHQGTLRFESETGIGTTFIIRIPISPADSDVKATAP